MTHLRSFFRLLPLLAGACVLSAAAAASGQQEQLVVFLGPGRTPAAKHFVESELPALRETAAKLGVAWRQLTVADGAPPEVTITPLIVFQDHRGRSVYQGRTDDPGKLAHFIRTSRAVPPTNLAAAREEIAVLEIGRARVASPLKITALSGNRPAGHDAGSFEARAREAIHSGFASMTLHREVTLGPGDRQFYMDFHPYLAEDGRLFVSTALFSQFDCIDPVFVSSEPAAGSWETAAEVFAEAARRLEKRLLQQLDSSSHGDGLEPVADSVPTRDWDGLGLALPPAPAGAGAATADLELGRRWRLEPADDDRPRLIFRFPAPLERYTGEVAELDGALTLAEDLALDGADGWMEAATASVTMGEETLDAELRGKMLRSAEHPRARFRLESMTATDTPLTFGRTEPFEAAGSFTMVGATLPLQLRGQVEPVVGADGLPRLHVNASFRIRLASPFGISGPDGPEPANDTLIFHLDLLLQPAEEDS